MRSTATPPLAQLVAEARKQGRVLLSDVDWRTYRGLLDGYGERPCRFTYDRGYLEITTRSREHELFKDVLGLLVWICAEEFKRPLASGGEMTFAREDLERALEPDNCYWIDNEHRVRGKRKLNFRRDPPPDLVLEIEISRTVLSRLDVYAALGVPEIWRFNGKSLLAGLLQETGHYHWGFESLALPIQGFAQFLKELGKKDQVHIVATFRAWVRDQIGRK